MSLCLLTRADVSAVYGKFGPTGSIEGPRPDISWKVTPTGGGHVSRVDMRINDHPVAATYNDASDAVEYKPEQAFAAGLYTVDCRATIDGQLIVHQDWSFEVDSGNAPSGSFASGIALAATNAIRSELGLPAMVPDDRMNAAAEAHSRYEVLNGLTCHEEDSDKPGFTGKAPWDRLQRFGFPGTCFEGACGNQMDPKRAVRMLFDAPYHRIAFLQPGAPRVGIGVEGGSLTIDYSVSTSEGVGASPAPGQTDIPTTWDGNESPSPMRIFGESGAVGYPIVFAWFSPRLESIRITSMRLIGPGQVEVPAYVNTPDNDSELRFAGVVTPKKALQPHTVYTVEVHATTERGVRIDKTWSFTTGV